ncbi:MAG: hypothetical protein ABTQ93_02895 [Candidatus Competibacter denitrificans]
MNGSFPDTSVVLRCAPSDLARNAALFDQLHRETPRLSPELADWINAAYQRWHEGAPLDSAFGLRPGPGQRNPATLACMAERNRYLRAAWSVTAGTTSWARARNLADAINRLPIIYRRYKAGHLPVTAQNTALCKARDCGRLPKNPKQLQTLCANQPPLFISTMNDHPVTLV